MKKGPGGPPGGKRGSKMRFLSLEKAIDTKPCLKKILNDRYLDDLSFNKNRMSEKNMGLQFCPFLPHPGGKNEVF